MATIKDVAELANVSIATVSNLMTGKKNVGPDKAARIIAAMKELNYNTDRLDSLAERRSMTIGFIVSQLDTVYFPMIIRGIQKVAEEHGYSLIFYPTNYSTNEEKRHLKRLLDIDADGIILDTVIGDNDQAYWDMLSKLKKNNKKVPIVSIQNDLSYHGIPSVALDNYKGGYMATEHLIQKGCKKPVCITGPSQIRWASARLEGYKKCLENHGLPYNSSYVISGDCSPTAGYQAVNYLLLNALEFDSIYAENDLMAFGAVKALLENGFRVPEDIKVIGYDNVFVSSLPIPSISTINIPKQRLGEESARLLINLIQGQDIAPDRCDILPLQLIERQTTSPEVPVNWDLFLF